MMVKEKYNLLRSRLYAAVCWTISTLYIIQTIFFYIEPLYLQMPTSELEPRRRAATPGRGKSVSDRGACGMVRGAESARAM